MPRIFNQNLLMLTLPLTEVRGFSPRTIYGRRSLPSKYEFDFEFEFDFKEFDFKDKENPSKKTWMCNTGLRSIVR